MPDERTIVRLERTNWCSGGPDGPVEVEGGRPWWCVRPWERSGEAGTGERPSSVPAPGIRVMPPPPAGARHRPGSPVWWRRPQRPGPGPPPPPARDRLAPPGTAPASRWARSSTTAVAGCSGPAWPASRAWSSDAVTARLAHAVAARSAHQLRGRAGTGAPVPRPPPEGLRQARPHERRQAVTVGVRGHQLGCRHGGQLGHALQGHRRPTVPVVEPTHGALDRVAAARAPAGGRRRATPPYRRGGGPRPRPDG